MLWRFWVCQLRSVSVGFSHKNRGFGFGSVRFFFVNTLQWLEVTLSVWSVLVRYLLISLGILGDATRCLEWAQTKNVFYWSDGIGSIQFTLTFLKQKAAINYLISYKYVMQLKPKKNRWKPPKITVSVFRQKPRFRFGSRHSTSYESSASYLSRSPRLISAAFDTIDHSILLERQSSWFGITSYALSWIKSYLLDRSFSVNIQSSKSSSYQLLYGVPQGSVLGPLLFILYPTSSSSHELYADDTQLYISFSAIDWSQCSPWTHCI